jgi:hypothetical protein
VTAVVTTAITIQGESGGVVRTIILTLINYEIVDETGATLFFTSGLSGTYSDTSGVTGAIRMNRF